MINTAKKKQSKLLWLEAMDCQAQAIYFYKKLGFKYHSKTILDFDLVNPGLRKMSIYYKEL